MDKPTISLSDFITGIIAGLAHLGYRSVLLKDFDVKVVEAFREWEALAEKTHRLTFWVTIDRLHWDSPSVREGFQDAVYNRDLGFFTDRGLGFKITPEYAHHYLKNLPGDKELWIDLANKIISHDAFVSKNVIV